MSTWTFIDTIVGGGLRHSVCSDKSDYIYWCKNTTQDVYEYQISTNTETLIIDSSAVWGYPITSRDLTLTYFNGGLYIAAALYDTVAGYTIFNVYKYISPGTVILVDSIGPHITATPTGYYYIFSNENLMITYSSTVFIGSYPRTTAEPFTRYTVNGLTWGDASFDTGTPGDLSLPLSYPPAYYPNGIYSRFLTEQTSAFVYKSSIYKFDTTQWKLIEADETHGYFQTDMTWDKHWTPQNTYGETTTNLAYDGYNTQDSSVSASFNYNMIEMLGITNAAGDVAVYTFTTGTWGLLDNAITNGQFDYADITFIQLTNNDVYIFGFNNFSGDCELWKRTDKLLPPVGLTDRLWIYKSSDGGNTWTSRGVMT